MSSEVRVVRPYVGLDRFQAILEGWRVRVGPDEIESGRHTTIPSANFVGIKPVLVTSDNEEGAHALREEALTATGELGLRPENIELLVVVSTPFLRLAEIPLRQRLSGHDVIAPSSVLGTDRPLSALQTPTGGCDIDVYFCLADHVEPRTLVPSRKGTWLGRARFAIRTEFGDLGFTPIPLTPDKRGELGLHDDTIRFVSIDPEDLRSESLTDVVQLYVDEGLLALTNQAPNTPAARTFQRQLYLDVIGGIVRAAPRMADFDQLELSELDNTFLGRVVETAGNRAKNDTDETFRSRCEAALHDLKKRPEHFVAVLEARTAPREDLRTAIGGVDT